MIKNTVSISVAACLALFALAACDSAKTTADSPEPQVITVEELAAQVEKGEITPCDSNGVETRTEHGTIPGAVLLTSYEEYDVSELPADKSRPLAFFCSSEKCSAAPKAAEKALSAGYTDVRWLKAGIKGWKGAGQKTQPVPAS